MDNETANKYWGTYGHLDFTLSAEEVIEAGDLSVSEVIQLVKDRIIDWDSPESSRKYLAATPRLHPDS